MSKKDDFKKFVANNPNLVNVVSSKQKSWQDLFEVYDLYGDDKELWDKYLNFQNTSKSDSSTTNSITELTKLFKNVNIDNVHKYIDTAQKAIGVIEELVGSKTTSASILKGPDIARPINKIFED